MKQLLSMVVPCFNEEESLPHFYEEVLRVAPRLSEVEIELILVDDGSRDRTLQVMRSMAAKDARVKYVSFSRNFGKEAAILAGLKTARGDFVALMDADLQDPPGFLPEMYLAVTTGGFDNAATRRVTRKGEPLIRSLLARLFYKLINGMSQTEIVDGARDFRLMRRSMVDAILSMPEYNRFSKGIFGWVGFTTKWLEYKNIERIAGTTKWSFWKLFKYSLEGIMAFSTVPLAIASFFGLLFCFLAFVILIFIVVRTLVNGDPVAGWPSLACLVTLMGGVQLLTLGIQGQYLAKTYLETKGRPAYLIKEQSPSNPGQSQ